MKVPIMRENMKASAFVVAAWIALVGFGPAFVCSYKKISFSTVDPTQEGYKGFLDSLRRELASGTNDTIAVLRKPNTVPNSELFILVEVSNSEKATITFAIHVLDIYILAYEVVGASQSYYLPDKDVPSALYTDLFDGTRKTNFTFSGNYIPLQNVGKINRKQLDLGMSELDKAISTLSRTDSYKDQKPVARSLIIAIQMISEAARFKYVEQQVSRLIPIHRTAKPNPAVISLENAWSALSSAVQSSDNGNFGDRPIQLRRPDGTPFNVTRVDDDLRKVLKLIKYYPKA